MLRLVHYCSFLIIVLFIGCTEEIINNQSNQGNIAGQVFARVDTGLIPLANVEADLMGTGQLIMTNSVGQFFFSNIQPGTFDLNCTWSGISLIVNDIKVTSGSITIIPDVIYDRPKWNTSIFMPVEVIYEAGNAYQKLTANDTNFIDSERAGMDSLSIQAFTKPEFYLPDYRDTTISIRFDTEIIITESDKGEIHQDLSTNFGLVDFAIWPGNSIDPSEGAFKCKMYILQKIYTKVELNWISGRTDMSAGDFDIFLVNNIMNDTCWFKNPNPDWGLIGKNDDDPNLDDETNTTGSTSASEELILDWTLNGTYTLLVRYHSNSLNPSRAIRPDVTLTLDDSDSYYSPPLSMSVGQEWTVLSFSSPSKDITVINTIAKTKLITSKK